MRPQGIGKLRRQALDLSRWPSALRDDQFSMERGQRGGRLEGTRPTPFRESQLLSVVWGRPKVGPVSILCGDPQASRLTFDPSW